MQKILVIDVGGTRIKLLATGQETPRKFDSGRQITAHDMVEHVKEAVKDWEYDVVSIGYPGPVRQNSPLEEPVNLGPGWVGYDFAGHLGKPTRVMNDAAMQALGSYEGGRMLFLGLGTGMGSAMIVDDVIVPMELAHLPYRKNTFEDYVGVHGLEEHGKKKWLEIVNDVVTRLKVALCAEYVVLGGGNSKLLDVLPPDVHRGDNRNAFLGGYRMWDDAQAKPSTPVGRPA